MAQPDDFCPYKGLLPYTDEDRDYFFGREEDQETIGANLATTALTIFYGASGVGKSSVLMAGVVPFLRTLPNVTVVVFRAWQDRIFLSLLKAEVARVVAERTGRRCSTDQPLDELLAQVARTTRGILAIILDQFEEYFLNHPVEEIGNDFEAELARAVNRDDIDANFLLSIREDGLSLLDRFQGRIPNLLSNLLRLEHLDGDAAIRAIRKPLDQYNQLRAAPGVHITIEDALVDALVDELRAGRVTIGQVGQGQLREDGSAQGLTATDRIRIETPFLQMVLTRLWTEEMAKNSCALQLSTFDRLGRAQQIVRTHLDDVMKKLDATEQEVCALFFDRLVTPSGNKIAYTVDDLREWAGDLDQFVPSVLKTLSDNRILRGVAAPPGQPAALRYEIFHDVLAPAILDWKARFEHAQELVRAETQRAAEAARQREELAKARALALEQQRRAEVERERAEDQSRAARRLKRLSLALAVVSLLVVGVGVAVAVMWKHSVEAEGRQKYAEAQAKYAEAQAENADAQAREALSRELAIHAHDNLNRDPVRSIRLALIASDIHHSVEAADALYRAEQAPLARLTLANRTDSDMRVVFNQDGRQLVTASADGTVKVWDMTSAQAVQMPTSPSHGGPVTGFAFNQDGTLLAAASQDKTVRIWEVASGREGPAFVGHDDMIYGIAFSPDGTQLATASADKTVKIWEVAKGEAVKTFDHTNPVYSVAFSPTGSQLATGSVGGTVKVWGMASGQAVKAFVHTNTVHGVAFSPNGSQLATASADGTARVWDVASGEEKQTLVGHAGPVSGIAFSPDGAQLATASADKTVKIWEAASGREVRTLAGHPGLVTGMAFSPDGTNLATASQDGMVKVWNAPSGRSVSVSGIASSPDGKSLAVMSQGMTVKVWEVASHKEVRTLVGHADTVFGVALSPNGAQLATASADKTVKIWEVASDKVRTLYADIVYGMALSPEGTQLATASADGTVKIWEVASGRVARTLEGHADTIYGVTFSLDGKQLATASADKTVKVWEVMSGQAVQTLPGHASPGTGIAFIRNGTHLATTSLDKMVVYPLRVEDLRDRVQQRIPHKWTIEECWEYQRKYKLQHPPKGCASPPSYQQHKQPAPS